MNMAQTTKNNAKVLFSVQEDEKLVEHVAKYPCLYDLASPVYKNQKVKDNAWKEVAEIMERSLEDCKKRWRNIKDTYQKRRKKGKGTGTSGSTKPKKWPLADMLSFLGKVEHKRQSISNIEADDTFTQEEEDNSDEFDEDISNALEDPPEQVDDVPSSSEKTTESTARQNSVPLADSVRPSNKRKKHNEKIMELMEVRRNERSTILKSLNTQNPDDDVDLFFKSIAMSVKKLRPELINEAKMKSLQMVLDLESRNKIVMMPQPSPSLSSSSSYYITSPPLVSPPISNNDDTNQSGYSEYGYYGLQSL